MIDSSATRPFAMFRSTVKRSLSTQMFGTRPSGVARGAIVIGMLSNSILGYRYVAPKVIATQEMQQCFNIRCKWYYWRSMWRHSTASTGCKARTSILHLCSCLVQRPTHSAVGRYLVAVWSSSASSSQCRESHQAMSSRDWAPEWRLLAPFNGDSSRCAPRFCIVRRKCFCI